MLLYTVISWPIAFWHLFIWFAFVYFLRNEAEYAFETATNYGERILIQVSKVPFIVSSTKLLNMVEWGCKKDSR